MKAVVLTGGKGTRLRPYTTVLPKPLMPVGERPILEILLRQLKVAGVTEVILAVNYMYQLIEAMFRNGDALGLKITYALEDKPLGTAGPLANVLPQLGENFLVLNGDLLTDIDLRVLLDEHTSKNADATIAVTKREVKIDYGVLEVADNGLLKRYIEKPVYNYHVSMGINVFRKAAVEPFLKQGMRLDIPELVGQMLASGKKVFCHRSEALWLDIGRRDDYELANEIFSEREASEAPKRSKDAA